MEGKWNDKPVIVITYYLNNLLVLIFDGTYFRGDRNCVPYFAGIYIFGDRHRNAAKIPQIA